MSTTSAKTWRVALVTRIGIGIYAAFMFGLAAIFLSLPLSGPAHQLSDWAIAVPALALAYLGLFGTFALVAVMRMHITIGETTLEATVVDRHNWLLVPHFRAVTLPLRDIRSVERRAEVYRTLGFASMRNALSVVTTRGERIGLFSNTLGSLDTLPLDDVAAAIASASGVPVTDDGTVRARGGPALYGAASSMWEEPTLDETTAIKSRRSVTRTAQICTGIVVLIFFLRIVLHTNN